MLRKRIVDSSSEDEVESSPRRKRHNVPREEGNVAEDLVGRRLRLRREKFLSSSEKAASSQEEDEDHFLFGTCEAYSPTRKAVLVVFDDPFGPRFDRFREKSSEKPKKTFIPSRISVAIWNEPEVYLQYDSGDMGWGGACTFKRSRSKREACYWWGAWVPLDDCRSSSEDVSNCGLEALLCLCRRVEVAEPPPPLLVKAGLAPKPAADEEEDKSALVECESCKEWYHVECAGMVARRLPNPDEPWRCPLCENLIKSPRLLSPNISSSSSSYLVSEEKLAAWTHESLQPLWRSHPPVQWQWWSNGKGGGLSTAAGEEEKGSSSKKHKLHHQFERTGEWVLALCTLRRFVTSKTMQEEEDSVSTNKTQDGVAMWYCLNRSYPVASSSREEHNAAHLQWALLMDELRRAGPSETFDDTESVTSAAVQTVSSSSGKLKSSATTAPPSSSSSSSASKLWSIPSRMRSYEEHMEILDSRRFLKKKKKNRNGTTSGSSGAVVEDAQGRNQRLEIRRVANAVGESALTIGRRRRLRFGRSPIHMWGVFADETISAGDFVAEYKGELISQKETDRRFNEYVARGMPDYLFKIDTNLFCDATLKGSLARFINHSCEPNCEAKIVMHQNQKRIALYAVRDISLGEELCYDYKFPIEEGAENKIPCNCGAKRCRRVMN